MASISQITNCFRLALDASGLEQADKDRLAAEAEGRYAAYLDQARQGETELAEQDAVDLAEFDRREIGRLAVTEGYAAQQYGEYIARYFELPQSVIGGKVFVNAALRGYLKRLAERIALADDVERNNEASGHILAEGEKRLPEKVKKNIERLAKPPKVKAAKVSPAPPAAPAAPPEPPPPKPPLSEKQPAAPVSLPEEVKVQPTGMEAAPEAQPKKPTGKKAGQRAALLAAGHTAEQIDAMPPREFGKALLDAEQKAKKEAPLHAEEAAPQLVPAEPTKREWSSLKKAMISKGMNDFRFFIIQDYPEKAKGWVDSGLYKDWYAQYGRDAKRGPKASQEHPSEGALTSDLVFELQSRAKKLYITGDLEIPQYMAVLDLIAKKEFGKAEAIVALGERNLKASNQSASRTEGDIRLTKAKGKADMSRLLKLIGSQMYSANLADVAIKEMIQNSYDAVRASLAKGIEKEGRIDVVVDPANRYIILRDNGQGMSPKTLRDAFLTVAGSEKSGLAKGEVGGGGFGMAKVAFLPASEKVWVKTEKDGISSTFQANGEDLFDSEFTVTERDVPKGAHGTTIILKIPETYEDNGERRRIWFPLDLSDVSFFKKPLLNDNVVINFSQQKIQGDPSRMLDSSDKEWGRLDFSSAPIGKNADLSGYVKDTTAKTSWGDIDVYIGRKRKQNSYDIKHEVLSSGVYQFDTSFSQAFKKIPYDVIVNVRPSVAADSATYPFDIKREGWKSTVKDDIAALSAYIVNVANGKDADDTVATFKSIVSLPKVDIDAASTSDSVDIADFILEKPKKADSSSELPEAYTPPTVTIQDGSVKGLDSNGKPKTFAETDAVKKKAEKTGEPSKFDAGKQVRTAKDFLVDVGIDDRLPIFHNNTSADYFGKHPNAPLFFSEIGSVMLNLRDKVAEVGGYGFLDTTDSSRANKPFFVGISIDKKYHGVNIVIPFQAALLNPLAVKGRSLPSIVWGVYETMVHEFTHVAVRDHDEAFISEQGALFANLAADGFDIEARVQLARIFKKHQALFNALRDEYEDITTQNIARSIHEGESGSGAASSIRPSRYVGSRQGDIADTGGALPRGQSPRSGSRELSDVERSRGSLGRIGLIPSGSGQPTVSKPPQYSISASVLPDERADRLAEEGAFSSPDEAVNHLAAEFGPGIRDMAANGTLVFGHGKTQWEDAIRANAARYAFDPSMPSVEEQLATLREHPDAEEMTLGGKVYFDLAAMPKDRLKPVALHSIGEHFSLERMLGAKGYSNLLDQIEILAQVKGSPEERIWNIVARDYGHLKPGESGIRGERDRRAFIAEVIAKLGEHSPNLPWYKRLLVKFKAWLASKGFLPMVRKLSGAEMHDLLAASLRAAAREASRTARYAPLQVPEELPAAATYSFGGERAALTEDQKASLEKAKTLEAEGMSQRTVWNETGWFRAPWDAGNWFTDAPLAKYSADGVPMGLPGDAETKLAQSREALSDADRAAQFPLDSLRDMLLKEGIDPGKNFQNLIAETGGGPMYSLPINPAEVDRHYAERADGVIKGFRRFLHQALNPLGSLPNEVGFLKLRYPTQGEVGRVSEMSRALFDAFEDVGDHAPSILKFLLTQDAPPSMIKDDEFRKKAVWAKGLIIEMGEKLVRLRVITEETFNARKGAYLPQLYLRSLLSDAEWAGQGFGSGKRPSGMSAAMWRKYTWSIGDDGAVEVKDRETGEAVPEDVVLSLGPIANPGFLLSKAYGVNMRDAAILEWLEQISKNQEWTLPESLVEWGGEPEKLEADRERAQGLVKEIRGMRKEIRSRIIDPQNIDKGEDSAEIAALETVIKDRKGELAKVREARKEHAPWKVTPFWLMSEADRIQKQAEHYSGDDKTKTEALAARMRAAGLKGKEAMESKMEEGKEIEGFPDKWRIMPDVKRYGMLRGLAVRREIYDDIVGYTQINTGDTSMAEKLLGDGGWVARYVQWWKWAKVAANPPAQLRNFITNAILLHLSGVPFHKVPQRLIQAFEEVRANGKHWQAVKRWGGTEATFAAKELPRIDTEMLALLSKEKGLYSWDRAREIWYKMVNTTGDWYQMAEAVSKTAKYIDEIEKGTSESDAMILAHKWLLDYSLVHPSVRYLRNAPIGAPFLCVDETTEILTQRGWLNLDQVQPGDIAASFNMASENLEWKPVIEVYRNGYEGADLMYLKDRHLDLAMTPDHRCVAYRKTRVPGERKKNTTYKKLHIVRANELNTRDSIPTAAPFIHAPVGEPVSNALVKLVGWYVTEGWNCTRSQQVWIGQNEGKFADDIREALMEAGFTWRETSQWFKNGNAKHINFSVHAKFGRILRELAPNKNLTPNFVMRLTSSQLSLLFDVLISADGHTNKKDGRRSFQQNSGETLDTFQMVAALVGKSFNVRPHNQACNNVLIREGTLYSIKRAKVSYTPYHGRIWCPMIADNETWLARRNGKPFITHNTFAIKVLPLMLEVAITHPLRFAPYVALPYIMTQIVASMNDVDDDDVEELKQTLPEMIRKKGHTFILPFKDANGHWGAMDYSVYFPWTQWLDLAASAAHGEVGEVFSSSGLVSGPLVSLIAAAKTGIDPFTKQPIIDERDSPPRQAAALMNYLWSMNMPTWLTSTGWAGHMAGAMEGVVDKRTGEPKETLPEAGLRLFGINITPFNPAESRRKSIAQMEFDISDIKRRKSSLLKDKNLSREEADAIRKDYGEMLKQRMLELHEYKRGSEINPKLL